MSPPAISTIVLLAHWLIIIGLSIRIVWRRPPVGVSLAWLTVIFSVPFFGAGVYLLFGEKRLGPWRADALQANIATLQQWQRRLRDTDSSKNIQVSAQTSPLTQLVENVLGFPVQTNNRIKLLSGYIEFFDSLITDIDAATVSVSLEFYIWLDGGRCDEVVEALIAAANRGVTCLILVDAVGSQHFLRSRTSEKLRNAGIKLVTSLPTGGLRTLVARTDLRNHRKIAVIDNLHAYTGGQNLVDPRYFKTKSGVGEWIDAMVRISGPTAASLNCVFNLDWSIESDTELVMPAIADIPFGKAQLQIVPSGPDLQPEAIHQLLLVAIYSAQTELVMTTPYFIPDDAILTAFITAALRGVSVTVIVPAHNDSIMARFASAAHFDLLMKAGVKIAQFNAGLLHTKSLVIDQEVSVFGSVNLDIRSLWLNFEISIISYDAEFARELNALQNSYLAQSDILDMVAWSQRPIWRRFIEYSFRLAGPLL